MAGGEGAVVVAPPVVPAAVSLAIAPIVESASRPGTVLGASDAAVWIETRAGALVVSTPDAVRLPNGVVAAGGGDLLGEIERGDRVEVGDGAVAFETVRLRAARWFDPRPALPQAGPALVRERLALLAGRVPGIPDHGFSAAIADDDDRAAFEAARRLIGHGDGLTPRGDDLLAGTVAAALLVGESIDAAGVTAAVRRLEAPVVEHAAAATTSFSASLLRHAFRGEVAEPVAALLSALTGRGDPVVAAASLMKVGHSSGPALAAGVLAGARAAVERSG